MTVTQPVPVSERFLRSARRARAEAKRWQAIHDAAAREPSPSNIVDLRAAEAEWKHAVEEHAQLAAAMRLWSEFLHTDRGATAHNGSETVTLLDLALHQAVHFDERLVLADILEHSGGLSDGQSRMVADHLRGQARGERRGRPVGPGKRKRIELALSMYSDLRKSGCAELKAQEQACATCKVYESDLKSAIRRGCAHNNSDDF